MSENKLSIDEYRKQIKEDKHTSSILEEEDDPSLQVDYESSDSSPNVSPRIPQTINIKRCLSCGSMDSIQFNSFICRHSVSSSWNA